MRLKVSVCHRRYSADPIFLPRDSASRGCEVDITVNLMGFFTDHGHQSSCYHLVMSCHLICWFVCNYCICVHEEPCLKLCIPSSMHYLSLCTWVYGVARDGLLGCSSSFCCLWYNELWCCVNVCSLREVFACAFDLWSIVLYYSGWKCWQN